MTTPTCPACGAELLPDAHYCTACGHAVAAAPAAAATASPPASGAATPADAFIETLPAYPLGRLVTFHLLSLGIFTIPWAFRLWKFVNRRRGTSFNAALRAVFTGFMLYDLLCKLEVIAAEDGVALAWNPPLLAVSLFLLNASNRLPGGWTWLCLLAFLPVLAVQRTLNAAARERLGRAPATPPIRLGEWLSVAIVWGALLVVVVATFVMTLAKR